jgi:hypothetical protein
MGHTNAMRFCLELGVGEGCWNLFTLKPGSVPTIPQAAQTSRGVRAYD